MTVSGDMGGTRRQPYALCAVALGSRRETGQPDWRVEAVDISTAKYGIILGVCEARFPFAAKGRVAR